MTGGTKVMVIITIVTDTKDTDGPIVIMAIRKWTEKFRQRFK